MSGKKFDFAVAGHVCLDILPQLNEKTGAGPEFFFTPGTLVEAGPVVISTGGPVSNTGIALARLGNRVTFIAKVGRDAFGRLIINRLSRWADTSAVSISDASSSSYTAVLAPPGVDRIFFHCPGANDTFTPEDVNFELCHKARVFHLGYPPLMKQLYSDGGVALETIFKKVRQDGVCTSLDMALPDPHSEAGQVNWPEILQKTLPWTDFFHPSLEEGLFLVAPERWKALRDRSGQADPVDFADYEDFEAVAKNALGWGAGVVTIKAGHRGIYLRTAGRERLEKFRIFRQEDLDNWAGRELFAPAVVPEKIVSATGAGDACVAGFMTAALKGESPERALLAGVALGRQNLDAMDATGGVRDWSTTLQMIDDENLERMEMPGWPGWRKSDCGRWVSR